MLTLKFDNQAELRPLIYALEQHLAESPEVPAQKSTARFSYNEKDELVAVVVELEPE